ncbi:tRNA (cmo5U34)-methyltransferase (plasmid) [Gemmatirosa kalamazoonensis]|uniref:Carboxy-S-adenosyl-L-methionine synthase n=1 Tax=Gemmatirosa kalamazoonensis TaxID=861299 RepID=W0RQD0_9BACT|nr:carboxy-S-adenosyl-L-methionine synthase CmoA [Gemmatirosa kalamazoonensis]AHG92560.1 tRNA (cmo5U34)-methyltransferase [Gemmatirosa kalamazoonensis]
MRDVVTTPASYRPDGAMPGPITPGGAPTDRIFADGAPRGSDFAFDAATVRVFDDMVNRSVPFYGEIQRMTCELAAEFAAPGSTVYDFGCSTGTTLLALDSWLDPSVRLVGVDNAPDMVRCARERLDGLTPTRRREVRLVDLHAPFVVEDASVSVMLFTLQFVRPLHRERVVRTIAAGTRPDGALIFCEKVIESETLFNRVFIDKYYAMKRRHGYSDMEIARKREALENVLIPYRVEENRELLLRCGFTRFQEFFRWYNFAGMIAVK